MKSPHKGNVLVTQKLEDFNLNRSSGSNTLIICAAIIVLLSGVKAASMIIVPFLLAVFFAIICNPLLKLGTKFKLPQWLSITVIISGIVLLGTIFAGIVGNSVNEFSQRLPEYKTKLSVQFDWIFTQLSNFNIHLNASLLKEHFDPGVVMGMVSNLVSSLGGVMANLFLIILTVIFMLSEADSFPKKVHKALNNAEGKLQRIDRFLSSVNRYLAIKTIVSICTGILAGTLCWAMEVNHYVLWGVLAFLFNYIPNVGSLAAAIPAVMLSIIEIGMPGAAIVAGGYITINMFMGNVIEPRFMGKGLGLSTLVVFLSLVFWGWLLGTVGMLLSVPLTMIVKIGLEANSSTSWVSTMLSAPDEVKDNA